MTILRRHLPTALLALVILFRLANFWGLPYGNTDDIDVDYMRMTLPLGTLVQNYAESQSRVHLYAGATLWAGVMSIANTHWYDFVNLGSFALAVLLPIWALRRYFLPGDGFSLCALVVFATLPLQFSYGAPYSYPGFISIPLTACGVAILLFQRSRTWAGLAAGGAATLFAICAYEAAMVNSIVLLVIYFVASSANLSWRRVWQRQDLRCAVLVFVAFAVVYARFRIVHPLVYGGVQASTKYLGPASAGRVAGTLSSTSSIYAWFSTPQWAHHIDPDSGAVVLLARDSWQDATLSDIAVAMVTAGLVFLWIARSHNTGTGTVRLACLAAVLLLAPNIAYPLTEKVSSLVARGELHAYLGTPYSQVGFGCAVAALAIAIAGIRVAALRVAAAILLSLAIGGGSLAASGFNRKLGVFAREQASRWKVMESFAACSSRIPAEFRQDVAAPKLWNNATAALSWESDRLQAKLYWDAVAYDRYGLRVHLMPRPVRLPVSWLDFRLKKDGALASVVVARSSDGQSVRESWACPVAGSSEQQQPGPVPEVALTGAMEALSPNRGEGMEQEFRVSVPRKFQNEELQTVGLLIDRMKRGVEGCYPVWDSVKNQGSLVNDSGQGARPLGPTGSVENAQCALLATGSGFESDGETIAVTFHLRFHQTFQGPKEMYVFREGPRRDNPDLSPGGWWWVRPSQ